MASSKNSSRLFNTLFPFADTMYLLQQEEYSLQRFSFWFWRFYFRRNLQERDTLKYTQRVKVTLFIATVLWLMGIAACILFISPLSIAIVLLILWCLFIPVIVLIANALTTPFYQHIKNSIIARAREYFKKARGNTIVIAVAGSYGKTSIKNFTEQLVRYDKKTQMIPGNINSTIGIAQWILKNFQAGTEVLIMEMDSYAKGRIARSCALVDPDIAILSNIGDQHLQRFGSTRALAESLSEVFLASPRAQKFTNQETAALLASFGIAVNDVNIVPSINHQTLSKTHVGNLSLVLAAIASLHIPESHIKEIIQKLTLPDRRQSLGTLFGYDAINDSYNISLTTAKAGIDEAVRQARSFNKKLIVITAGIPELGPEQKEGNTLLGAYLNDHADSIIVLASIFQSQISKGVSDSAKYVPAKNFIAAVEILKQKYPSEQWFLLLQPELTDLYY